MTRRPKYIKVSEPRQRNANEVLAPYRPGSHAEFLADFSEDGRDRRWVPIVVESRSTLTLYIRFRDTRLSLAWRTVITRMRTGAPQPTASGTVIAEARTETPNGADKGAVNVKQAKP